jgi:predicted DNA-binding antitoxin AbrB/MazE fold protein
MVSQLFDPLPVDDRGQCRPDLDGPEVLAELAQCRAGHQADHQVCPAGLPQQEKQVAAGSGAGGPEEQQLRAAPEEPAKSRGMVPMFLVEAKQAALWAGQVHHGSPPAHPRIPLTCYAIQEGSLAATRSVEGSMSETLFTVEAVFENGVLRPFQPLPLAPQQRVLIAIEGRPNRAWPADTAAIYQDIAEEDRRLTAVFCRPAAEPSSR